jgi:hypothetical protein
MCKYCAFRYGLNFYKMMVMGIQQYNKIEKTRLIGYILQQRRVLDWNFKKWAFFCKKEGFKSFLNANHVLELRRLRVIIDTEVIVFKAVAAEKEKNSLKE